LEISILLNLPGSSAGNPNAIIPIGFTYTGNSSISETFSSRNAPTKHAPIPSFTAVSKIRAYPKNR
jgi:hypothetical protein